MLRPGQTPPPAQPTHHPRYGTFEEGEKALFGDGNHFVGGHPGSTGHKRALAAAVAAARQRRRESLATEGGKAGDEGAPEDDDADGVGGGEGGEAVAVTPQAPASVRPAHVLGGRAARVQEMQTAVLQRKREHQEEEQRTEMERRERREEMHVAVLQRKREQQEEEQRTERERRQRKEVLRLHLLGRREGREGREGRREEEDALGRSMDTRRGDHYAGPTLKPEVEVSGESGGEDDPLARPMRTSQLARDLARMFSNVAGGEGEAGGGGGGEGEAGGGAKRQEPAMPPSVHRPSMALSKLFGTVRVDQPGDVLNESMDTRRQLGPREPVAAQQQEEVVAGGRGRSDPLSVSLDDERLGGDVLEVSYDEARGTSPRRPVSSARSNQSSGVAGALGARVSGALVGETVGTTVQAETLEVGANAVGKEVERRHPQVPVLSMDSLRATATAAATATFGPGFSVGEQPGLNASAVANAIDPLNQRHQFGVEGRSARSPRAHPHEASSARSPRSHPPDGNPGPRSPAALGRTADPMLSPYGIGGLPEREKRAASGSPPPKGAGKLYAPEAANAKAAAAAAAAAAVQSQVDHQERLRSKFEAAAREAEAAGQTWDGREAPSPRPPSGSSPRGRPVSRSSSPRSPRSRSASPRASMSPASVKYTPPRPRSRSRSRGR